MKSDPNDSGTGQTMAKGGCVSTSTRVGPRTSTNPVQRTGRPDGTQAIRDNDPTSVPHAAPYRQPKSVNPTNRAGRPDADASAPQRSYARATSGNQNMTEASAGRVHRS